MAGAAPLLLLRYGGLKAETLDLFEELGANPELRRIFFADPVTVLKTKLASLRQVDLSEQQCDLANGVLFSLLSNDKFLAFSKDYQRRKHDALVRLTANPADRAGAQAIDERQLQLELATAVLEYGDTQLVAGLLGASTVPSSSGTPPMLVSVAILVASLAVIFTVQVLVQTGVKSVVVVLVDLSGSAANALDRAVPLTEIKRTVKALVGEAKRRREIGVLG